MRPGWTWVLVVAAAAGAAGCDDVSPIYVPTVGGYAGANISPKNTWVARGTLTNPQCATDNDMATEARTDYRYEGAELVLDLGRPCLFQTVVIEHGKSPDGHPRTLGVSTSLDGKNFTDRHTGPGTRRVTILSLPEPVLARYVCLKALKPGTQPWAVAEVYLQ